MSFDFACNKVSSNDSTSFSVYDNQIQHFVTVIHLDFTTTDLTVHSRISSQQQLLSGLSFCIKRTRYLCSTKRTAVQKASVFPSQWHSLSHTLVDDVSRNFSQTIYVGLSSTVVSSLYSIIEQTVSRVTVSLIVLSSIDTSLSCNRVSSSWRILKTKCFYVIAQFSQCSCS